MERTRYHEIVRPLSGIARSLGSRVVAAFDRQPQPKNIVDRGKTAEEARAVQLVLEGMHEYHPAQTIIPDDNRGFDSEGNYHAPELRIEHVRDTDTTTA